MFKFRRTGVRRCKENHRLAERSDDKRLKFEGNSNITSNRVTIPPGFLCLGVTSENVQNRSFKRNFDFNRSFFLSEGLLDHNSNENHKLRRSARLSKKTEEAHDHPIARECQYKDLRNTGARDESKKTSHKCKSIVRNNSKSLFREINERYAKVQIKKSVDFDYPVSAVIDPYSKVEYFYPSTFCRSLSRQISLDLKQNSYVLDTKLAIGKKIRHINDQLLGKTSHRNSSPSRSRTMDVNGEQNDFEYIPRRDWVYQTPPRQEVVLPRAEECAIQPAVICTARKQSNIYEMHPNFKLDLTGFTSRQNVEVDGRYMRHLASFEERRDPTVGFGVKEIDRGYLADAGGRFFDERNVRKEVTHLNPCPTVSGHFAQVTCRPTKTVKKISRTSKFYQRKSEESLESTPTGPNLFETVEELGQDVTLVHDNGTFKLVNTQTSKDDTFEFKFRKNLFRGDDDKVFNFSPNSPNMFDFSKLKDN